MEPWETVSLIPSGLENRFKPLTIRYKVAYIILLNHKVKADDWTCDILHDVDTLVDWEMRSLIHIKCFCIEICSQCP